jgi:hypothetical protein
VSDEQSTTEQTIEQRFGEHDKARRLRLTRVAGVQLMMAGDDRPTIQLRREAIQALLDEIRDVTRERNTSAAGWDTVAEQFRRLQQESQAEIQRLRTELNIARQHTSQTTGPTMAHVDRLEAEMAAWRKRAEEAQRDYEQAQAKAERLDALLGERVEKFTRQAGELRKIQRELKSVRGDLDRMAADRDEIGRKLYLVLTGEEPPAADEGPEVPPHMRHLLDQRAAAIGGRVLHIGPGYGLIVGGEGRSVAMSPEELAPRLGTTPKRLKAFLTEMGYPFVCSEHGFRIQHADVDEITQLFAEWNQDGGTPVEPESAEEAVSNHDMEEALRRMFEGLRQPKHTPRPRMEGIGSDAMQAFAQRLFGGPPAPEILTGQELLGVTEPTRVRLIELAGTSMDQLARIPIPMPPSLSQYLGEQGGVFNPGDFVQSATLSLLGVLGAKFQRV